MPIQQIHIVTVFTLFIFSFSSCKKIKHDELLIKSERLPALQGNQFYSAWLIVDGDTLKAGNFNVEENGEMSTEKLTADPAKINSANSFGISIESSETSKPSHVFVCSGEFDGDQAILTTAHPLSFQTSFSSAQGTYIMATVTDAAGTTHEFSGIWWVTDISGASPGLTLPDLPEGWTYEGWVKINDQYVSTGRFSNPNSGDDFFQYGDTLNPPFNFPGEDLLYNAPQNVTFPVNLKSKELFISVEYVNSIRNNPYLVILQTTIPSTADFNTPYQMNNSSLMLPTITITRKD